MCFHINFGYFKLCFWGTVYMDDEGLKYAKTNRLTSADVESV